MPVEDHAVHERVKIGADYRYGCHNMHRPTVGDTVSSTYSGAKWPYVFSTECRFGLSLTDPACTGCEWRGSGEAYDAMVRSKGK